MQTAGADAVLVLVPPAKRSRGWRFSGDCQRCLLRCGRGWSVRPDLVSVSVRDDDPGAWKVAVVIIDCDTCAVRGAACSECVITVLLDSPFESPHWDESERQALGVLAESGLLPRLRWVMPRASRQAG